MGPDLPAVPTTAAQSATPSTQPAASFSAAEPAATFASAQPTTALTTASVAAALRAGQLLVDRRAAALLLASSEPAAAQPTAAAEPAASVSSAEPATTQPAAAATTANAAAFAEPTLASAQSAATNTTITKPAAAVPAASWVPAAMFRRPIQYSNCIRRPVLDVQLFDWLYSNFDIVQPVDCDGDLGVVFDIKTSAVRHKHVRGAHIASGWFDDDSITVQRSIRRFRH